MATTTTWQAIFAPQYNTYYFYNPLTEETTWINPLQQEPQPESSTCASSITSSSSTAESDSVQVQKEEQDTDNELTSTTTSAVSARHAALQAAALAQGIDPLLAHLDPSLLASPSILGTSGGGTNGMLLSFLLTSQRLTNVSFKLSFISLSVSSSKICHHLQQNSMLELANSHPLPRVLPAIYQSMNALNECLNFISM